MELLDMELGMNRHMEDDEVERYSMREMTEEASVPFEEHLLTCAACRNRVEETDLYVAAMAGAARQIRNEGEKQPQSRRSWVFRPAWAAALATVAVAILASTTDLIRGPEPLALTLHAMRGTSPGARVQANHPLLLTPDLTGLPGLPAYRVEIVNANGKEIFHAIMTQPPVKTPRLAAGTYFVRILSPAGELLREYGLEVAR